LYKEFPEGGVLLALVGRSNGLGPVDAAHTFWPVISVPVTYKEFPEDVWSSLRMPSKVPMATILPDNEKMGNAVDYALRILAQKNPAVYAHQQAAIEKLDI
jgi:phosphoribosylaminoimidazole carboxylase / phosphoribosylaminoimidazole-succinocarboxamide synthase